MRVTSKTTGNVGTVRDRAFQMDNGLRRVLQDPRSKDYTDLRDRAAFVYITGTMPTHLRSHMTGLLRSMATVRDTPTALDASSGSMKVDPHIVRSLRLEAHPMVEQALEFIKQGYKIAVTRDLKARRPFSRVFLYRETRRGVYRMTVHSNGAIREGWDGAEV